MTILLFKIFVLLLVAAVLGALLGYWWCRRYYEDVTSEYNKMEKEREQWRSSLESRMDLTPLNERIDALERAVKDIKIPPATTIDLEPIQTHLAAMEKYMVAPPAGTQPPLPAASEVKEGSRNLLSQPVFGNPDDLKLIKGVANVLEKMLHRIGVYYFWQIADWRPEDVKYANDQLEGFKGRIKRDAWVAQCRKLALEPEAAKKPEGL